MKYSVTPVNIFCALLTGLEIVFFVFPQSLKDEHYGYQHVFLLPVIAIGLFIDFILQKIIKKYSWLFIIEMVLIATVILLNITV